MATGRRQDPAPSGAGKPVDGKPAAGGPVNGKPVNGKSVNGKSVNGKPVNGKSAGAVAAGARRASGERARRQRRITPLLADVTPPPPLPADPPATAPDPPAPDPSGPDLSGPDGSGPPPDRVRPAARRSTSQAGKVRVRAVASRRTSGGERLVAVADAAQQTGEAVVEALSEAAGTPSGQSTGELEERIVQLLAFLRRRLTGDFAIDDFGFDADLTDTVLLNLLRPLYRHWFRVEVRGIENVPDVGGALIVANHSGGIALDALMTQVAVHDEHPRHRHLRMLGADLVFATPFLGTIARKGGATLAGNADAERLLSAGEVVGVWPEGFKGVGKPFSERYKLQRFGRGGFVSAALKTRTPIVPCAIVGAEETYPIIGDMPAVARLLGLPYAPITPTWPALGLLGMIPLPSKWLIEFGAPVPTDEFVDGAHEDPMLVFDLTDQVRQSIQQTLYSLLVQRRSVFF